MSDNSKETVSFRLDKQQRRTLDALARASSRKRSDLIADALRSYLDVQRWQLEEIEKAVTEADAKEFVSEKELRRVLAKLTK